MKLGEPNWLSSHCPTCHARPDRGCAEAVSKDDLTMHWIPCAPHQARKERVMGRVRTLERKFHKLTGVWVDEAAAIPQEAIDVFMRKKGTRS